MVQTVFEQCDFLGQDPSSKILRSAVGKSQDEMGNVVLCGIVQFGQERIEVFLVLIGMNVAEFQLFNLFQNLKEDTRKE